MHTLNNINVRKLKNIVNHTLTANLGGTKEDVESCKELVSDAASDAGAVANSTTGDVSCDLCAAMNLEFHYFRVSIEDCDS